MEDYIKWELTGGGLHQGELIGGGLHQVGADWWRTPLDIYRFFQLVYNDCCTLQTYQYMLCIVASQLQPLQGLGNLAGAATASFKDLVTLQEQLRPPSRTW